MPKFYLLYQLALIGSIDVLPQLLQERLLVKRGRARLREDGTQMASEVARLYNGALYQDTPDRIVFETSILPFYQLSKEHQTILFIGCDWYTFGYARLFAHKTFWTLDASARKARYGAQRHLVATMRNAAFLFEPGSVDLVICNGVLGWGLEGADEIDASFAAAYRVLRPGGHLVLGWNDKPPHNATRPADIASLRSFEPLDFLPLGSSEYAVDHELRHVYTFYAKPSAPG